MKLRNTLILFVILVALGTYVYFVEIKHHEKVEQAKQESKQLFNMEKDSVETLILDNSKGVFTVKKIQNEWRITDPVYTEADESTINTMLTSLLDAQKEAEFSLDEGDLSNYGLSDRAMYVRLNTFSGEQDSIWIGEKTPVGSFVFSFKNDSMVYTINQSVKTNFDKSLFDIRDKNLLHFNRDEVRRIVLNRPGQKIEFETTGASDWQILNINRPADNGKISGLLGKLSSNKAKLLWMKRVIIWENLDCRIPVTRSS